MSPRYSRQSWIDPRVELRPSPMGMGTFAGRLIHEGEVIFRWGGVVLTESEMRRGWHKPHTASEIDVGIYLCGPPDDPDSADDFTNHSCDPTAWLADEATVVARHEISAGEEITLDYATFSSHENDVVFEDCRCGAPHCRGIVTEGDWRRPELQERYREHFSPHINELIVEARSEGRPPGVRYGSRPVINSEEWARLEADPEWDWSLVLLRSLTWVGAYQDEGLVGFVNVAWDGGVHAFLLDPRVHPTFRRRGIGTELVRRAARVARRCGVEWLHVDFEPALKPFYDACGFRPTEAGLIRLQEEDRRAPQVNS